jgi:hypothetical protein
MAAVLLVFIAIPAAVLAVLGLVTALGLCRLGKNLRGIE